MSSGPKGLEGGGKGALRCGLDLKMPATAPRCAPNGGCIKYRQSLTLEERRGALYFGFNLMMPGPAAGA